jgi:hypothetical protein
MWQVHNFQCTLVLRDTAASCMRTHTSHACARKRVMHSSRYPAPLYVHLSPRPFSCWKHVRVQVPSSCSHNRLLHIQVGEKDRNHLHSLQSCFTAHTHYLAHPAWLNKYLQLVHHTTRADFMQASK